MAKFSISGGDDGEGPSNHRSRKRQRLPSINEDEENANEDSDSNSESPDDEEEEETVANQSSSSKDSSVSVTLTDPDVLDCPICCEPLKIPIFQCDNGHLACSSCCNKVRNRCPSCTLPVGYIRCRAMEKVIETSRVSCPNSKYGCQENTLYGNKYIHEKNCVYTPCSCPVPNCNYTGYYKDLNRHVSTQHEDEIIPFESYLGLSVVLHFSRTVTVLQEMNDGLVVVFQVFKEFYGAYVSVSCIAPEVRKYSCSLVNSSNGCLLKQGLMMNNIQEVRNELPEDGYMLIPSYMFSGNEYLNLQILIGRGRCYAGSCHVISDED